mmetsp:Transcript_14229/g.25498  ORF Transcript_14229/g.25498 Transcript_14229/m.25498 type:complete len:213 (-) Transcript_14229:311-949(-)
MKFGEGTALMESAGWPFEPMVAQRSRGVKRRFDDDANLFQQVPQGQQSGEKRTKFSFDLDTKPTRDDATMLEPGKRTPNPKKRSIGEVLGVFEVDASKRPKAEIDLESLMMVPYKGQQQSAPGANRTASQFTICDKAMPKLLENGSPLAQNNVDPGDLAMVLYRPLPVQPAVSKPSLFMPQTGTGAQTPLPSSPRCEITELSDDGEEPMIES